MVFLRSNTRKFGSGEALNEILTRPLTNSLVTSPLVFAAKIKAFAANPRQLRRLAIGSHTRLLAAGFFFSKGHLDE